MEEKSPLMAHARKEYFGGGRKKYMAGLMAKMEVADEDINVDEEALYDEVREYARIDIPLNSTVEKTSN